MRRPSVLRFWMGSAQRGEPAEGISQAPEHAAAAVLGLQLVPACRKAVQARSTGRRTWCSSAFAARRTAERSLRS